MFDRKMSRVWYAATETGTRPPNSDRSRADRMIRGSRFEMRPSPLTSRARPKRLLYDKPSERRAESWVPVACGWYSAPTAYVRLHGSASETVTSTARDIVSGSVGNVELSLIH